jgi:hypothetical protein
MKSPLPWIGLFAQGCNLVLGSPAAAQAVIEPDAVGTPWTGEMGVRESTAQLMAREPQLAVVTHARVLKPRLYWQRNVQQPASIGDDFQSDG